VARHMIVIAVSAAAALLFFPVGCAPETAAGPAPAPAVAGLPVRLPEGWKSFTADGRTTLTPKLQRCHIQLWTVPGAAAPADVLPRVAGLIQDEVREFKVVSTEDLVIAGKPAKHLIGTGLEADDGDDSNAEVFIFSAGRSVILVCAHGEGEGAAVQRAEILAILDTAR
jgi:hypothetical protein